MSNLRHKTLISQLVPTVNFVESPTVLKIESDRLDTPKFIKFDNELACRECSKIDYLVSKDGCYIQTKRLNAGEKFVPFDLIYEIPQYCAFSVRSRRLFRFPYVFSRQVCKQQQQQQPRKRPLKQQEKQQADDIPILTGVLPHLISEDSVKESTPPQVKKEPEGDQEVPILTTVLPHLYSHIPQQEPIIEEASAPKEDSVPILTAVLPHLVSASNQANEEEETPQVHHHHQQHNTDAPVLTTLLPHLESHL